MRSRGFGVRFREFLDVIRWSRRAVILGLGLKRIVEFG